MEAREAELVRQLQEKDSELAELEATAVAAEAAAAAAAAEAASAEERAAASAEPDDAHLEAEIMDRLQSELAAALDEKESWIRQLRAARESQQAGVETIDELLRETHAQREAMATAEATIAQLGASNAELREQLNEFIGHANHRQRIQHTMMIKEENGKLKAERTKLQEELARTDKLINRLRLELDRTQRRMVRGLSCGPSEAGCSTAPSIGASSTTEGGAGGRGRRRTSQHRRLLLVGRLLAAPASTFAV